MTLGMILIKTAMFFNTSMFILLVSNITAASTNKPEFISTTIFCKTFISFIVGHCHAPTTPVQTILFLFLPLQKPDVVFWRGVSKNCHCPFI